MSVAERISVLTERAFEHMDRKTGMFPEDWTCLRCNVKLNADGGHPAELYAGTFNGLCYRCTGEAGFVIETLDDGCQVWSYPPHCPSWRRDRERFLGFPDCGECNGTGQAGRGRSFGGSSFPLHCRECMDRHTGRGAYDVRDPFSRDNLSYDERVMLAYVQDTGHDPSPAFEPGSIASKQWTYTGKGSKAKRDALVRELAPGLNVRDG